MQLKVSLFIKVKEQHLMGQIHRVSAMTLVEMFQFLVLIILDHLIMIIKKNNFLVLGRRPTDDINDSVGTAEKKLSIGFTKANTKLTFSLYYIGDENYI